MPDEPQKPIEAAPETPTPAPVPGPVPPTAPEVAGKPVTEPPAPELELIEPQATTNDLPSTNDAETKPIEAESVIEDIPEVDDSPQEHVSQSTQKETSTASSREIPSFRGSDGRTKALEKRRVKRDEYLQRILQLAKDKGTIRNDDIKILLRISDRSAVRYANMLVVRGALLRSGKGRSVVYKPRV